MPAIFRLSSFIGFAVLISLELFCGQQLLTFCLQCTILPSMHHIHTNIMDEPQPKRIRLACSNCRYDLITAYLPSVIDLQHRWCNNINANHDCSRKKTRCSGERPACAFCVRLQQDCQYDDGSFSLLEETSLYTEQAPRLPPIIPDHTEIAVRLALLSAHQSFHLN